MVSAIVSGAAVVSGSRFSVVTGAVSDASFFLGRTRRTTRTMTATQTRTAPRRIRSVEEKRLSELFLRLLELLEPLELPEVRRSV